MSQPHKVRALIIEQLEGRTLCTASPAVYGPVHPGNDTVLQAVGVYGPQQLASPASSSAAPRSLAGSVGNAVAAVLPTPTNFWKSVASALSVTGNSFSAYALRHSLQSTPANVNLNSPTGDLMLDATAFLAKLRIFKDLKDFVVNEVAKASKGTSFQVSRRDTLAFSSANDFDLFGTLHKLDNVTISGTKDLKGNWSVSVSLLKKYDFQWSDYRYTSVGSIVGAIGNNLAFVSQAMGTIHGYNIAATLTITGNGTTIKSVK